MNENVARLHEHQRRREQWHNRNPSSCISDPVNDDIEETDNQNGEGQEDDEADFSGAQFDQLGLTSASPHYLNHESLERTPTTTLNVTHVLSLSAPSVSHHSIEKEPKVIVVDEGEKL